MINADSQSHSYEGPLKLATPHFSTRRASMVWISVVSTTERLFFRLGFS